MTQEYKKIISDICHAIYTAYPREIADDIYTNLLLISNRADLADRLAESLLNAYSGIQYLNEPNSNVAIQAEKLLIEAGRLKPAWTPAIQKATGA